MARLGTARLAQFACLLLLLAFAKASPDPPRTLPNDAYIWQLAWTPALAASVADNAAPVRAWRVLVDETAQGRTARTANPDWRSLAASGRKLILVHRIDGGSGSLDATAILARQAAAVKEAGLPAIGMEIDFDCATARLSEYAAFLRQLRDGLPPGSRLSITALPSWLSSPALGAVISVPDETVLQVHAISDPAQGLFDPDRARRWIDDWALRSRKPFRVALPAYAVHVDWTQDGRLAAVVAEMPRQVTGARSAELIADPAILSGFVRKLSQDPPATLAGLVWFRLPSCDDRRSWSPATWRAVLGGSASFASAAGTLQTGDTAGLQNIVLFNPGDTDIALPRQLTLDPACTVGDAANGYEAVMDRHGLRLVRIQDGLLTGKSSRIIGWTRCSVPDGIVDVSP